MNYIRRLLPYASYALLSLVVLGPLLAPGYVLTMDMVFTPVLRLSDHVDNTWLLYALLHALDVVLPADVIQKLVLGSALLLSGVGMHRLLLRLRPGGQPAWPWAMYAGSVFYMINPFVYDRLMAGQWGVWLGYALLPWFATSLYALVRTPQPKAALRVTGWLVAISIVSIHSLGLAFILLGIALATSRDKQKRKAVLKWSGAAVGLTIVLSLYWLFPAVTGQGRIANSLTAFTADGRSAFATVDSVGTGQVGAVLGLLGFWQEKRDLYVLPIESYPLWGFSYVTVLALVMYGAVRAFRAQRPIATYAIVVAVVAVILAVGPVSDMLARYVPFFAGYREPQKFVALLALCYSYFAAWGALGLMGRLRGFMKYAAVLMVALLPLAYTPPLLWGAAGQLQAVNYPVDWFEANRRMGTGQGKVLFLPWHLYMTYSFTNGRIIASPAKAFYDRKVVISDDPELPGVGPQTRDVLRDKIQRYILPVAREGKPVAPRLRELGIDYLILNKSVDWQQYASLVREPEIELLFEGPSLRLYRIVR